MGTAQKHLIQGGSQAYRYIKQCGIGNMAQQSAADGLVEQPQISEISASQCLTGTSTLQNSDTGLSLCSNSCSDLPKKGYLGTDNGIIANKDSGVQIDSSGLTNTSLLSCNTDICSKSQGERGTDLPEVTTDHEASECADSPCLGSDNCLESFTLKQEVDYLQVVEGYGPEGYGPEFIAEETEVIAGESSSTDSRTLVDMETVGCGSIETQNYLGVNSEKLPQCDSVSMCHRSLEVNSEKLPQCDSARVCDGSLLLEEQSAIQEEVSQGSTATHPQTVSVASMQSPETVCMPIGFPSAGMTQTIPTGASITDAISTSGVILLPRTLQTALSPGVVTVTLPQIQQPESLTERLTDRLKNELKREKDREKKRAQRANAEYREKERERSVLRMRSRRQDPMYRETERVRDRIRRKVSRQQRPDLRTRERERDRMSKRLHRMKLLQLPLVGDIGVELTDTVVDSDGAVMELGGEVVMETNSLDFQVDEGGVMGEYREMGIKSEEDGYS